MTARRPGPPPPYADGLERAFADARRRRWRTLAVTVSAPAVILAIALTTAGPALDRLRVDSIEPTTPRPAQSGAPAAPHRTADVPQRAQTPTRVGLTPTSSGGPARPSAKPRRPRTTLSGPMRRELVDSAPGLCEPTAGTASWCADAFADHVGGAIELSVLLCPHAAHSIAMLSFRDDLEVEMSVRPSGGAPAWWWSHGRAFPKDEHYVDVPPSHCVLWRTAWDARSNDGVSLAPGRYRLGLRIRAAETGYLSIDEVEFSIR